MPEISFSVSARTARLIGQENFANADGAIIELVKNCYDADSENAIVFFDYKDADVKKHCIYIIDNGIGMTDTIIKDNWMMIGTDNKEADYESELGRVKTGAKGIGRFALDRLGEKAQMFTLPKKETVGFFWSVNWEDFKKRGISISDVKAKLEPLPNFNYRRMIGEVAKDFVQLQDYLAEINLEKGTLIKIQDLRDVWGAEDISRLFNNLEILTPPHEQPDFKISLFSKNNPTQFGELQGANYDDYDYKLHAEYLDDEEKNFKIEIYRNELDVSRIRKEFIDVFDMPLMSKVPFDFESFQKEKIEYKIPLNELIKGYTESNSIELIEKVGKFKFTFYFLKNTKSDDRKDSDLKKYPYRNFNSANRRAWLRRFGGVKIFRDEFRVRPYGEYGQDWLSLGERQVQSPQGAGQRIGGYRIRPNQISGTVNISRTTNLSFQDKSGREGIQENEVFDLFKEILLAIINQFEKDRNIIMFSFSELHKIKDAEEAAKREAEELAKEILRKREEDEQNEKIHSQATGAYTASANEIALAKGFQAQEEEIQGKDEEIRLLRSLSGTGLIVASVAHELRSLRTLLVGRTDDLKLVLEKLIKEDILKSVQEEEHPFIMLKHMREQDIQVRHWLEYSLSALKKDKRTRTDIDILSYFDTYKANWESVAKRRLVSLNIRNELAERIVIRGFVIDFDTIFNNLLINSFDSFKRAKSKIDRQVNILVSKVDNYLQILFSDNGAGLASAYQKNPEEIFLPFETAKVDRKGKKVGTGLGMYLVKSIINDYKGEIEVVEMFNGFTLQLSFPLRKTNENATNG